MFKKTITPVISLVLLILLMISIVTGAFYWMTGVQEGLQESTGAGVQSAQNAQNIKYNIITVACDDTDDSVKITALNSGDFTIDASNAVITVSDMNGVVLGVDTDVTGSASIPSGESFVISADGAEWDMDDETTYSVKLSIGSFSQTAICLA